MTNILSIIAIIVGVLAIPSSVHNYALQQRFHRAWKRQYNELQAELDDLKRFLNYD
jgi:hypothetical protein